MEQNLEHAQVSRFVVAIQRCIYDTFDAADWKELAYVTNGQDLIYDHPRLLRSFRFGDDDYRDHVLTVVSDLVAREPSNLQRIMDHISLQVWLRENRPQDYEDLFGHTQPLLDSAEEIAIANSFELNRHITRIRAAVDSDPELAIGSTKEMIESVLKTILEASGEVPGTKDLPQLLKLTQKNLNLDPSDIDPNAKGSEIIKRTLSNLGQVVNGINELRNLYGTGHGRTQGSSVSPRHARLVVSAGAALTVFLMETFEYIQQKDTFE